MFSKLHTVCTFQWIHEEERTWLDRVEHRFACFEDALEFLIHCGRDGKIHNHKGECVHEHNCKDHCHDDGYCY